MTEKTGMNEEKTTVKLTGNYQSCNFWLAVVGAVLILVCVLGYVIDLIYISPDERAGLEKEKIVLEKEKIVIGKAGGVCEGGAIPEAALYDKQSGDIPGIAFIGGPGSSYPSEHWRLPDTVEELNFVVCIDPPAEATTECLYEDGKKSHNKYEHVLVRIVRAKDGLLVDEADVRPSSICPSSQIFGPFEMERDVTTITAIGSLDIIRHLEGNYYISPSPED